MKQKKKQHTEKGQIIQLHVATDRPITTYHRHAYHTNTTVMNSVQTVTAAEFLACIAGLQKIFRPAMSAK